MRSLSHLRVLLTERADDSHAVPVPMSLRKTQFLELSSECQTLVRFFGSFRIEPHVPLVVCLPANSFEFQPCGRTPQAVCLTGYLRQVLRQRRRAQLADIRLGLGLRRSLICFAPLAFVSQRQLSFRDSPSPPVFPRVSTHFTTPP